MSSDGAFETSPTPARSRRRTWLIVGIALAVLIGAGIGIGIALSSPKSNGSAIHKPIGPTYPKAWDPRIAPLAAIASDYRGLKFLHPVYVEFLSPKDFAAQVTASGKSLSAGDRKQIQQAQGMMRALGVISGKTDLLKEMNTLSSSGILGLYDETDKKIRVRGTALTPAVKVTLVHELTHVLQDQHFDIGAKLKKLDASQTEDSVAFDAVVEGDARRIENKYRASLPPSIRAELDKSDNAESARFNKESKNVPGFLVTQMGAPYELGEIAVSRAADSGGNASVDKLFETPPIHEIQLLRPWLIGQPWDPHSFNEPSLTKAQTEQDRGEFGAFGLYLVLAERIPMTQALAAADSWGGDQYVSYTESNRTCVQSAFTGQTSQGTQRIETALSQWAKGSDGAASVSRDVATVTLKACDPGPNYKAPADRSMQALELLATRNGIESSIEKDSSSLPFAVCYASTLVQRLSITVLNSEKVSPAVENQIRSIAKACYPNP